MSTPTLPGTKDSRIIFSCIKKRNAGIERLLLQFPGFPVCIDFDPILFENECWLGLESVSDPGYHTIYNGVNNQMFSMIEKLITQSWIHPLELFRFLLHLGLFGHIPTHSYFMSKDFNQYLCRRSGSQIYKVLWRQRALKMITNCRLLGSQAPWLKSIFGRKNS